MDVLSDIIGLGERGAALSSRYDYRGSWGIRLDDEAQVGLHYVERGRCWLRAEGLEPVELMQGDLAVLPRGGAHALSDAPGRRPQPLVAWLQEQARSPAAGPINARVLCAVCPRDEVRSMHPLMQELPAVVHVPGPEVQRCPTLAPCLALLMQEVGGNAPGRSAAVGHVLGAVMVYVIRHWIETQPVASGWVGAVRDPGLARALSAMHAEPEAAWTVPRLAHEARMSRATFARRFGETVGLGPSAYLAQVRLTRSAQLLADTDAPLAQIAERVGYTSEFAYSRAFKRVVGVAPSAYRLARGPRAPA